jgi:hypothetical protein
MAGEIQKYREPEQLVLDFFIQQDKEKDRYSQTVELYDAIPKYVWGKVRRGDNGYLPTIVRIFRHKSLEYEVQIKPARILKGGVEACHYPGVREEVVEDALRKIATEGRMGRTEAGYGLEFTLYELRRELKRTGHTYSNSQLKEALEICAGTGLKLTCVSRGNSIEVNQNIFPLLVEANRQQWIEKGQKVVVEFNSLVARSIERKTFRQINYERSMLLTSSLARWLHKRMSHNYRQAQSFLNTYTISLQTILRDSGMTPRKRIGDSRKFIVKALDELRDQDVLYGYDEESLKDGRKLLDVKFIIRPSTIFSSEMKRANAKAKMIE